ncbi:hypothetical protein ABZ845_31385 [Streptomyces sp. NPDC047022]|uniref:hypothetical protein n=1 Tax=Streptomyces sp. NPDC047022 TaxID=3155737 RepID=UPI0033C23708
MSTPLSPDAYVANGGANDVSVIDTIANTVVAILPVGTNPVGVAITPGKGKPHKSEKPEKPCHYASQPASP